MTRTSPSCQCSGIRNPVRALSCLGWTKRTGNKVFCRNEWSDEQVCNGFWALNHGSVNVVYGCTVWCKRIGRVSDYERGLMLFRLNIGAFIHSIYKGDMRTPTKKCCHLPSKSTTKQHRGCAYLMHPYLWSLTLMTSSAKWWCSEKGHRRSWLVIHMIFTVFQITSEKALFLEGFWKTWMYTLIYLFILHIYSFFVCKILTPVWSRSYASELNEARNWQNISDPTCVECFKMYYSRILAPHMPLFVMFHIFPVNNPHMKHLGTLWSPTPSIEKNAEAKIAMEITPFRTWTSFARCGFRLIFLIAAGRVDWNTPERASKSHIGQIWVYELAVMYIS